MKDLLFVSVEIPTRCSFVIEFIIPKFTEGSKCFERHTTHHQELQTVLAASGLYTRVVTGRCLGNGRSWWWAVCRSKQFEPSINFGIINSITKLHLVGISTESSTMHRSMNIKPSLCISWKNVFQYTRQLPPHYWQACIMLLFHT